MIRGIMGRKAGMTRVFEEGHGMIAVSVIQAGPCFVTQVKTAETDGYDAIQIGYEETNKLNKPERGPPWRPEEPLQPPAGSSRRPLGPP